MSKLNCILNNFQQENFKEAIRELANIAIEKNTADRIKNPNTKLLKLTVDDIYNDFKKEGLDVDKESIAFLYQSEFKNDIDAGDKVYQTQKELEGYKNTYGNVQKTVKDALINAGFFKINKEGNKILDWHKIMYPLSNAQRKSADGKKISTEEQKKAIKDAIKSHVENVVNKDDSITDKPTEIKKQIDVIEQQLQNDWKNIIANAIARKNNTLNSKNTKNISNQHPAVKRLAELVAMGLTEGDNEYKEAVRKIIGVSDASQDVLKEIDDIGRILNKMQEQKVGFNSDAAASLEVKINALIHHANFIDMPTWSKVLNMIKGLFDLANLAILNNPANRGENALSSLKEIKMMEQTYGKVPKEIKQLGSFIKKDISRYGGVDVGGVTNNFLGDKQTIHIINDFIQIFGTTEKSKAWISRVFNFINGVTALNGNDNKAKIQLTWVKFLHGMEQVLQAKNPNMPKSEITKILHEQIFGEKWNDARFRAEAFMREIDNTGKYLKINKFTIERFTADLIKSELVENTKINLSSDEIDSIYKAAFTSAGYGLGHVPNNLTSRALANMKRDSAEKIKKALDNKDYYAYNKAMIMDVLLNRGLFRMIGGGTNWAVIKLQTGGLGIVTGIRRKGDIYNKNSKRMSELTPKELEETILETQRVNDRFSRGVKGALLNTIFLIAGIYAKSQFDDDDFEKMAEFMGENRWANKYVNKFLPFYLQALYAFEMQKYTKEGNSGIGNFRSYSPARQFLFNTISYKDESSLDKLIQNSINVAYPIGKKESTQKGNRNKAIEGLSKTVSDWVNINPLPYKTVVDVLDIVKTFEHGGINYKKGKSSKEYKDMSYPELFWSGANTMSYELNKKGKGE